jgi:hypothetical protein
MLGLLVIAKNDNQAVSVPARTSSDRVKGLKFLSSDKVAKLGAIGQDPLLDYRVTLDGIFRETNDHLDLLARQVREGKNVLEASSFYRWLQFSSVLTLLERHSLPGQDFRALRRKLTDLIGECGEHFRNGRVAPKYAESDITEINHKLDTVLAAVARPAVVTGVTTTGSGNENDGRAQKQLCSP